MDDPASGGDLGPEIIVDLLPVSLVILYCVLTVVASLYFATITYALRDFSRVKLEALLSKRRRSKHFEAFLQALPRLTL